MDSKQYATEFGYGILENLLSNIIAAVIGLIIYNLKKKYWDDDGDVYERIVNEQQAIITTMDINHQDIQERIANIDVKVDRRVVCDDYTVQIDGDKTDLLPTELKYLCPNY